MGASQGKHRRKNSYRTWCLSGLLAVVLVFASVPPQQCGGPGSASAPMYYLDSYKQLKEEFADVEGIIFPNISKYDKGDRWSYVADYHRPDLSLVGYRVCSDSKSGYTDFASMGIKTQFAVINISCFDLDSKDPLNPTQPLDTNIVHRLIPLWYIERDITESVIETGYSSCFPKLSQVGQIEVYFDMNGYRYGAYILVNLTYDELLVTTYKEKMALAHDEVFVLVDDLLDKGGVPK